MSNTISDRIFKDTSEKKMLNKFDILYISFIVFLSFFITPVTTSISDILSISSPKNSTLIAV